MIKDYEDGPYGAEFKDSEKPSDLQVSACRGKLLEDANPTGCFALNGPFGDRDERGMANDGDIKVGGVTKGRRHKGPNDYTRWEG